MLLMFARGLHRAMRAQAQQQWWRAEPADLFELAGFAEEPLPPSSPLWAMEHVIITGHYAGSTPKYNQRAMAIFLDNLQRYRSGEPLRNVVDKQAGY